MPAPCMMSLLQALCPYKQRHMSGWSRIWLRYIWAVKQAPSKLKLNHTEDPVVFKMPVELGNSRLALSS